MPFKNDKIATKNKNKNLENAFQVCRCNFCNIISNRSNVTLNYSAIRAACCKGTTAFSKVIEENSK